MMKPFFFGSGMDKKRIMVVDDDVIMRRLYHFHFRKKMWEVEYIESGQTAWDRLAVSLPDLALFDVDMPGKSGLQLLAQLRAQSNGSVVPVVMVTAHDHPMMRDSLMQAGVAEVFGKPFSPNLLLARIEALLS